MKSEEDELESDESDAASVKQESEDESIALTDVTDHHKGTLKKGRVRRGCALTSQTETASSKSPVTMWSSSRTAGVQLLVHACGCPLAWTKLVSGCLRSRQHDADREVDPQAEPEDTAQCLDFLTSVEDASSGGLSSYIAYDRSCHLLAAIEREADGQAQRLLEDTSFIVDAFHFASHSPRDSLCRTFCDPAPLDGSAPDLVVPMKGKKDRRETELGRRPRVFRRAFNTNVSRLSA